MKKDYTVLSPRHLVDQRKQLTNAQMEQLDEKEGRRRVAGYELDALVMLNVGRVFLHTAMEDVKKFAKEVGVYQKIAPSMTMLDNACRTMTDHISRRQCQSIDANYNQVTVSISSLPVPQWTNIKQTDLSTIINQATRMCSLDCTCSREQAKRCELRKALDTVPGMKEASRSAFDQDDCCPYLIFSVPDAQEEAL